MSGIRRYGKAVFRVGFYILGCYFAWIRRYARHPEKYPYELRQRRVKKLASKALKGLDIELHIEGKENIPNDICFFYGNHMSIVEPFTMVAMMENNTSYISKEENRKMPFVGKVMLDLEGVFLIRDDLKQSLKAMMHVQEDLQKKVKNWCVFPEGTRNKDSMRLCKEFHHGSFRPAMKAKVPLVPIAFYGSHQSMKTRPIFKKYPVFVKFLKPIMPEEYEGMSTNQVAKMVQDRIQACVSFELRKKYDDYMSKYKNYRFNQM